MLEVGYFYFVLLDLLYLFTLFSDSDLILLCIYSYTLTYTHSLTHTNPNTGSMHPAMMHPRIREAMANGNRINSISSDDSAAASKVPVVPLRARERTTSAPSSIKSNSDITNLPTLAGPGIMGLIMPIYSIVIVVFFLYTMFKLISRNEQTDSTESSSSLEATTRTTNDDSNNYYLDNYSNHFYSSKCNYNSFKRQNNYLHHNNISPISEHVENATKEINKLACEYSQVKPEDLVEGGCHGSSFHYIQTMTHCDNIDSSTSTSTSSSSQVNCAQEVIEGCNLKKKCCPLRREQKDTKRSISMKNNDNDNYSVDITDELVKRKSCQVNLKHSLNHTLNGYFEEDKCCKC